MERAWPFSPCLKVKGSLLLLIKGSEAVQRQGPNSQWQPVHLNKKNRRLTDPYHSRVDLGEVSSGPPALSTCVHVVVMVQSQRQPAVLVEVLCVHLVEDWGPWEPVSVFLCVLTCGCSQLHS